MRSYCRTISLRAEPPGTTLTLVHEDLAELGAAMPEVAASVGPGWEAVLPKLGQVLAETSPAGVVTR